MKPLMILPYAYCWIARWFIKINDSLWVRARNRGCSGEVILTAYILASALFVFIMPYCWFWPINGVLKRAIEYCAVIGATINVVVLIYKAVVFMLTWHWKFPNIEVPFMIGASIIGFVTIPLNPAISLLCLVYLSQKCIEHEYAILYPPFL